MAIVLAKNDLMTTPIVDAKEIDPVRRNIIAQLRRCLETQLAWVQAEPGNWRYGLPSSGSIPHLVVEDTKIRHDTCSPAKRLIVRCNAADEWDAAITLPRDRVLHLFGVPPLPACAESWSAACRTLQQRRS